MSFVFNKATKKQAKLRMALIGPSGSGKTYTALNIATNLEPDGVVAVLDTERGSAALYADEFDFVVAELTDNYHPNRYIEAIHDAEAAGVDVLIIDSLSHEWDGPGGCLELVDKYAARYKGNSFAAWGEVTPLHQRLLDTINASTIHIIATMRAKTKYILTENKNGKQEPRKVGMGAIQREGAEYEFGVIGELDIANNLVITKTRCRALDGYVQLKAGAETAAILREWLTDGVLALSRAEAVRLTEYARNIYGLENGHLLAALGVERLSAWPGGYQSAVKALDDYIVEVTRADQVQSQEPHDEIGDDVDIEVIQA